MTISADDIGASFSLPPERAIRFLERKQAQVTGPWTEWMDGQHARGFTAANVTKLDVLQDLQNSLVQALKKGQTLEQWKDGLVPELQRKGWLGRDYTAEQLRAAGRLDEATGEIRKGLTPARLKNIFQTNMQSAYMSGRYDEMIEQAEERPYWEYIAILDGKTRPAHRAMHGRIFRYDDGVWRSAYPPNGYKCRCRVRNYSERDIQRRKLKVDKSDGHLSQVQVPLRDGAEAEVTRYSSRSLPGGKFQPDVGFSNNPGQTAWQPRLDAVDVQLSQRYVETAVQGPAFERFVQGKDQGIFPVAVLGQAARSTLASDTAVAYLQSATVAARPARPAGPALTVSDWRRLPEIADSADRYSLDSRTSMFWWVEDAWVWRLVLRASTAGDELAVASFDKLDRGDSTGEALLTLLLQGLARGK